MVDIENTLVKFNYARKFYNRRNLDLLKEQKLYPRLLSIWIWVADTWYNLIGV